jgi:hypothetical protein
MDGAALHITHLLSSPSDHKNVSSDKLCCSEVLYNVASSDRPHRLDNTMLLVAGCLPSLVMGDCLPSLVISG